MALDWSKEISFSGLRKSSPKKKDAYPSKTHMNLAVADRKTVELRKTLPAALLLIVVVALFLKFGVFDFVNSVQAKESELSGRHAVLAGLESQLAGYDDVLAEYSSYASAQLGDDGQTVSSLEALALVDSVVRPVATVSSLNYASNELSLTLANASLSSLGDLVNTLYQQPIVENVSVANATTRQTRSDDVLTAMTITLHKAGDAR